MGEKIRALGERARARDLYDVISFFRREDLRLEAPAVLQVLREKCEFKGIPVPDLASLQPFRKEMESDWEVMLGHQLPAVPPIESFWSAIPEFFTWLHESTASSSPTGIPIGPDEAVVGASSTSQDLGMDAPALERIRFAAANRLCVDLGYQGDMKRVEPYSAVESWWHCHAVRLRSRHLSIHGLSGQRHFEGRDHRADVRSQVRQRAAASHPP